MESSMQPNASAVSAPAPTGTPEATGLGVEPWRLQAAQAIEKEYRELAHVLARQKLVLQNQGQLQRQYQALVHQKSSVKTMTWLDLAHKTQAQLTNMAIQLREMEAARVSLHFTESDLEQRIAELKTLVRQMQNSP